MNMVLEGTRALGDELIPIFLLTSTVAHVAAIYYAIARTPECGRRARPKPDNGGNRAATPPRPATSWNFSPVPASVCETNLEAALVAIRNLEPFVTRRLGPDDSNTKVINEILGYVPENLKWSIPRSCAVCHPTPDKNSPQGGEFAPALLPFPSADVARRTIINTRRYR